MILQRCKGVHCVDLDESFQAQNFFQIFVSIQPGTSPVKFAAIRVHCVYARMHFSICCSCTNVCVANENIEFEITERSIFVSVRTEGLVAVPIDVQSALHRNSAEFSNLERRSSR